ncbi:MAG: CIA30 family protein, partial [Fibrobacterales bacterium]
WVEAKNAGESVVLDSTVTDTLGAYSLSTSEVEPVTLEVSLDSFTAIISNIDPAGASDTFVTIAVNKKRWYQITVSDTNYFGKTLEVFATRYSLGINDSGVVEYYGFLPENYQFFIFSPQDAVLHSLSDSVLLVKDFTMPFDSAYDSSDTGVRTESSSSSAGDKESSVENNNSELSSNATIESSNELSSSSSIKTVAVIFDDFNDGDWETLGSEDLRSTWNFVTGSFPVITFYEGYDNLADYIAIKESDFHQKGLSIYFPHDSEVLKGQKGLGVITNFKNNGVDLSGYTHIRFFVKGSAMLSLQLWMTHLDDTQKYADDFWEYPLVTIHNEWRQVTIAFNDMERIDVKGESSMPDTATLQSMLEHVDNIAFSIAPGENVIIDSIELLTMQAIE